MRRNFTTHTPQIDSRPTFGENHAVYQPDGPSMGHSQTFMPYSHRFRDQTHTNSHNNISLVFNCTENTPHRPLPILRQILQPFRSHPYPRQLLPPPGPQVIFHGPSRSNMGSRRTRQTPSRRNRSSPFFRQAHIQY